MADALGIVIVPLSVRFGDTEYIDRTTITGEEFWAKCASSSELPETAAPSPGQFEKAYRDLAAEGATGVVVISLSSAMSATMQSAELGARACAGDVNVKIIDSRNASLGLGLIVLECAERAKAGASMDDIVALANDIISRTHLFGALDTLDNLKKGGRTPKQAHMQLNMAAIRPTSWQLQDRGRGFPPNHLHETWHDWLYWDIELQG